MEYAVTQWLCPYCGASIRSDLAAGPHPLTGKRYCPGCGEQLWTRCKCGQSLKFDDQICPGCGAPNPIHYKG